MYDRFVYLKMMSYQKLKRICDIISSLVLLVVLFPFLLFLALVVSIDSPGFPIFRQKRIGKDFKVFTLYKYRTMHQGTSRDSTGYFLYKGDSRVTRIGWFLRRLSLDELPQIFNILINDMSFVGPRPPIHDELGPISEYPQVLRKRFRVKPGLTGLAQVSGRNENDWDQKVFYDNLYVDQLTKNGLAIDLLVIAKTIWSGVDPSCIVEKERNSSGIISKLARKNATGKK